MKGDRVSAHIHARRGGRERGGGREREEPNEPALGGAARIRRDKVERETDDARWERRKGAIAKEREKESKRTSGRVGKRTDQKGRKGREGREREATGEGRKGHLPDLPLHSPAFSSV